MPPVVDFASFLALEETFIRSNWLNIALEPGRHWKESKHLPYLGISANVTSEEKEKGNELDFSSLVYVQFPFMV